MEKNQILSVLKRSFEKGIIVSVYSNRYEPGASSAGFIDAISEEQFVMKHVTPEGISDGYIIRRMEDVFRIDIEGEYEQRLQLLYTLQKQKHEDFINKLTMQGSNLFKKTLEIAQKKNLMVTICIDETEDQDSIVGFVKNVNSKEATISRVSFNGLSDGESTFFIEDVVKINCDTVDEKLLKLLFDYKKR